jgi:hypothetical protein
VNRISYMAMRTAVHYLTFFFKLQELSVYLDVYLDENSIYMDMNNYRFSWPPRKLDLCLFTNQTIFRSEL